MSMNSTAKSLQTEPKQQKKITISSTTYLMTLVTIFCLVTCYFINTKLVVNNVNKVTTLENKWYVLTVPNVYPNGSDYMYNLLNTESTLHYAKRFGDRVVPWEDQTRKFTAFNFKSSSSRTTQEISEKEQQTIIYNLANGEREIQFYHPEVKYEQLPNALSLLDKLDPNTSYEMALSFTKSYPFVEARFLLDQEDTEWLWVDSISDEVLENTQEKADIGANASFTARNIFGFPFTKNTGWGFPYSFLSVLEQEDIQNSEYADQANSILNVLKENDKDLEAGKVRIIGAVVTGTPEQLKKYAEMDFIRASSLGASVSIY